MYTVLENSRCAVASALHFRLGWCAGTVGREDPRRFPAVLGAGPRARHAGLARAVLAALPASRAAGDPVGRMDLRADAMARARIDRCDRQVELITGIARAIIVSVCLIRIGNCRAVVIRCQYAITIRIIQAQSSIGTIGICTVGVTIAISTAIYSILGLRP